MQTDLFGQEIDTGPALPECVEYVADFLQPSEHNTYFHQLKNQIPWQQPMIEVFGKSHVIPRKQCWMGDSGLSYQYSGQTFFSEPWHSTVDKIRRAVSCYFPIEPNACLLNLYRDGSDKMGWHSDDEPELGREPVVVIVSLGGARTFQVKRKSDKRVFSFDVEAGSLLIMKAGMQTTYQHQIPVRKRQNDPRISLTFRTIIAQ